MSQPVIQGWCPGALRPMLSGDGLVVRIRAHLGRLTSAQAIEIAALSRVYGNGLIDLSARANLQLRGVSEATHAPLIEGLRALGLVDADAGREALRNILISPLRHGDQGMERLSLALEAALANDDAPKLPGKFGFAIDTGPAPILRETPADIRFERDATGGLMVTADGACHGSAVSEAEAVPAAIALARWFLATGGAPSGRGRMRKHLATGAALPPQFLQTSRIAQGVPPPGPGLHPLGALVGFEFGQMAAHTLAALGRLGDLRLTPWRMLMIEGAGALPDLPDVITSPDDPMRRVIACTGAPGCVQALQPTRDLARALAPFVPKEGLLHVSGCAKGCAHVGTAPLTLVATRQGFDLIRMGDAAAPPNVHGLAPDATTILKAL